MVDINKREAADRRQLSFKIREAFLDAAIEQQERIKAGIVDAPDFKLNGQNFSGGFQEAANILRQLLEPSIAAGPFRSKLSRLNRLKVLLQMISSLNEKLDPRVDVTLLPFDIVSLLLSSAPALGFNSLEKNIAFEQIAICMKCLCQQVLNAPIDMQASVLAETITKVGEISGRQGEENTLTTTLHVELRSLWKEYGGLADLRMRALLKANAQKHLQAAFESTIDFIQSEYLLCSGYKSPAASHIVIEAYIEVADRYGAMIDAMGIDTDITVALLAETGSDLADTAWKRLQDRNRSKIAEGDIEGADRFLTYLFDRHVNNARHKRLAEEERQKLLLAFIEEEQQILYPQAPQEILEPPTAVAQAPLKEKRSRNLPKGAMRKAATAITAATKSSVITKPTSKGPPLKATLVKGAPAKKLPTLKTVARASLLTEASLKRPRVKQDRPRIILISSKAKMAPR